MSRRGRWPVRSSVRTRSCWSSPRGGWRRSTSAARGRTGRATPLVAIKRPHRHLASDKIYLSMLLDEARLASAIAAPERREGPGARLRATASRSSSWTTSRGRRSRSCARSSRRRRARGRPAGSPSASSSTRSRGCTCAHELRDAGRQAARNHPPRRQPPQRPRRVRRRGRASPTSGSPRPRTACRRRARTR